MDFPSAFKLDLPLALREDADAPEKRKEVTLHLETEQHATKGKVGRQLLKSIEGVMKYIWSSF